MPTYTFKSNKTGKEWDDTIRIAELDAYYIEHDCDQVIGAPTTLYHGVIDVHSRTTDEFKDKMKDIHKAAGRNSRMVKGPDQNLVTKTYGKKRK